MPHENNNSEVMLTMQGDKSKAAIVAEAARVLRPGGRYAIHELGVAPDDIDEEHYTQLRRDLARAIHVNARPMTAAAWRGLLEDAGLVVDWVDTAPMALLKMSRNLRDEGPGGAARIMWNVMRDKALRARVMEMRRTFTRYEKDMVNIAHDNPASNDSTYVQGDIVTDHDPGHAAEEYSHEMRGHSRAAGEEKNPQIGRDVLR